jgi:hypothetical protein
MKKVPYRGPTNIWYYHTKFSCPGDMAHGTVHTSIKKQALVNLSFVNKTVCLHSHSNIDKLDQNSKEHIMKE